MLNNVDNEGGTVVTVQEREAVRAWKHLGALIEAQWTRPGGFAATLAEPDTVAQVEAAAWQANAALKAAGLLEAPFTRIMQLEAELA